MVGTVIIHIQRTFTATLRGLVFESCEVPKRPPQSVNKRLLICLQTRPLTTYPTAWVCAAKIVFFHTQITQIHIFFHLTSTNAPTTVIPFGHLPYRNGSMNPLTGIVPFLCDCHPCVIPPAPSSLQNLSVHCNIVSVACLRHAVPRNVPYPTLRLSPCVGLLRWRASGTRATTYRHPITNVGSSDYEHSLMRQSSNCETQLAP